MRKYSLILLAAAYCCGVWPAYSAILDSNFRESNFANVGSDLTGMAWAPDGSSRLFISKKAGNIVIVKDGALLSTPFATISPIYTDSECGLVGICFDPNFMINGYVYAFVTVSASEQQIIRYTAAEDIGTNKTTIVSNLPTIGANHDGGGIGIGADGKLYWSVGDNGSGAGVNANMTSLASKVGRANLDGSVPSDNPFVDGPGGTNDYIWARGFRNPFTLTFQPTTGELWVDCVGTSYEQIFLVRAGDHAGWNAYENNQPAGFIKPKIKYRTNGTDAPGISPGSGATRSNNVVTFTTTSVHGFRLGEKITVTGVGDAGFNGSFYVASIPNGTSFTVVQAGPDASSGGGTATTLYQGGCVTGGCFYDSTAVPSDYRQNYFFGDLNSGMIMRTTLDSSNEVTSVDYFVTNSTSQIDVAIGPDGALYYGNLGGTVFRLAYTNLVTQQIAVTPTVVRMFEGGTSALTVCLAMPPPGDVEINVAPTSGDADITVTGGATLTFSPANWSVPQVVQLHAATDVDSLNDTAGLTISATGLPSQSVTVHALDIPEVAAETPSLEPLAFDPFQLRLNGQSGSTYILEGNADLFSAWTPLSTNTLTGTSTNLTDLDSAIFPMRFYRARLAP